MEFIDKVFLDHLDVPNKNGRIYSKEVMEKAILEYQHSIDKEISFGHLGLNENDDKQMIKLAEVSHQILSIRIEDDKVMGDIKVFDTPAGKVVQTLKKGIDNNDFIFVPNMIGTIEDNIVTKCKIISIDLISNL